MATLTKVSGDKTEGQPCYVPAKHPLLGQLPLYIHSVYILSCLERMVVEHSQEPAAVLNIALELREDDELMRYFHQALKENGQTILTVEDFEKLKEFKKNEPSWWEKNVEERAAAFFEKQREQIPEGWDRTEFDIKMGVWKGVYSFGKGTLEGLWEVVKLIGRLFSEVEIWKKIGNFTYEVAKAQYVMQFGSVQQRQELNTKIANAARAIFDAVANQVLAEWDKAESEGKLDELVAKWVTCGILEIATIALAILKGPKVAKAAATMAKTGELATGTGKLAKGARTVEEVVDSVADVLKLDISKVADDGPKMARLFTAAKTVVDKMGREISALVKDIAGAKVTSILKRDDPAEFAAAVAKKNKAEKYESVGDMIDMARGRVEVANDKEIREVAKRLKEAYGQNIEIKSMPSKYPRVHALITDTATSMRYELQVGTFATTEMLESPLIKLPKSLIGKLHGQPNFHDIWYDRLMRAPKAMKKKYGLDAFEKRYDTLLKETLFGKPQEFARRQQRLANQLSRTIKRMETEMPGYIQSLSYK